MHDDSGLMLLGHRYYDASTGRFLSRDPVGDGSNWYVYCGNNPCIRTDETGLMSISLQIALCLDPDIFNKEIPPRPLGVSPKKNIKELEKVKYENLYAFAKSMNQSLGLGPMANFQPEPEDVFSCWLRKVYLGGEWDYKVIDPKYENFGNFNYGATGAYLGIPLVVLHFFAGVVQTVKEEDYGNWWSGPPWGDDPKDQYWIEQGYKWYIQSYEK